MKFFRLLALTLRWKYLVCASLSLRLVILIQHSQTDLPPLKSTVDVGLLMGERTNILGFAELEDD